MGRIEKTVFLSYRRTNALAARAIFQNLTHHGYDVFLDFNGIASGDFETVILENIRARAHFIVLLTPSALEKCGQPGDWLRREIEFAIEAKRNIVPLMLEGFRFDSPGIGDQLTGRLTALRRYNALSVPAEFFDEAMDRLRTRFLAIPLDMVLHPASALAVGAARAEQKAASAGPAVTAAQLTAEEWLERGMESDDFDEQVWCFTRAIQLRPDFAFAFNCRGNARFSQGNREAAMSDYNQAIRLDPRLDNAFYNRALLLTKNGDAAAGIRDLIECVRLAPNDPDAVGTLGLFQAQSGDLAGGLVNLEKAVRLAPNDATALERLGIFQAQSGDSAGALENVERALRIDPRSAKLLVLRGTLRGDLKDRDGAIRDYEEALRLDPGNQEATKMLDLEQRAVDLERRLAEADANLAQAEQELADAERAEAEAQQAERAPGEG